MNLDQATEKVYNAVNIYGLTNTLYTMFGKRVRIRVTFTKKDCDTPIEELSLSVRSYNALKRAGLDDIGKVVDALSEERITKIRNLGGKSIAEIQGKVMEFGFDSMNVSEKKDFLMGVLKENSVC